MNVPDFGIDINFIDNRTPGQKSAITVLDGGFMTNSITAMVDLLRDTADKLEKLS